MRTRITHRDLNGIIRRWDDDFWKQYYPPNDWGCRCDVRQLDEAAETDLSQRKIAPNKPFFQNNVGIGGQAFTDKHPYYHTLKDNVEKKKVFIASERLMPKYEPPTDGYSRIFVHHKSGGYVDVSNTAHLAEKDQNIKLGKVFAKQGKKVKILPHSSEKGVKNPEVEIDGVIGDFKRPSENTLRSLQSQFESANSQKANFTAIILKGTTFSTRQQMRVINSALNINKKAKRMYGQIQFCYLIYDDNTFVKITRKMVEKNFDWTKKLRPAT